ncbi:MAG: transcription termination factor Rho [Myxococcales bacterium]|jgi:transcription termination factor Rho|nr:transcription termination factor Rho [Myxococcales bacterium]
MEKPTASEVPRKRRSPPRTRKAILELQSATALSDSVSSEVSETAQSSQSEVPRDVQSASSSAETEVLIETEERAETTPSRLFLSELRALTPEALCEKARALGLDRPELKRPRDLFFDVIRVFCARQIEIMGEGALEILSDGYGFLRSPRACYLPSLDDVYLSPAQIRRFNLRVGDSIRGALRPPPSQHQQGRGETGERYFAMWRIDTINGEPPKGALRAALFDTLTPLYPQEKLRLEHQADERTTRIIDLFTPIGKGQRCLIVAPPRTGKTMLLQNIAHAITANHPEVTLIVLLIDERPEEVTDMARSVHGEVVSSTFDESATRHVQVAEMVLEKAKRLVEHGRDVVILLDSITRLARAYNAVLPASGKILSGGVDANALHKPKRFFGSARNVEEGGSLTIIGTALVETGSRMDEVIFEEFKGTGNAEIVLDRKLMEKRLFPCLDLNKSGTRKEELLMDEFTRNRVWILRQVFQPLNSIDALGMLLEKVKGSKTNRDFLDEMSRN